MIASVVPQTLQKTPAITPNDYGRIRTDVLPSPERQIRLIRRRRMVTELLSSPSGMDG